MTKRKIKKKNMKNKEEKGKIIYGNGPYVFLRAMYKRKPGRVRQHFKERQRAQPTPCP